MEFEAVKVRGMLMGVTSATDFQTKNVVGAKLDLGRRTDAGKFVIDTIKVLGAKQTDFTNFLDEVVEIQLENVTISSYLRANQAMISLKAQKATIL
ncbi:TPA: hypothetical protein ACGO0I_001723 [Streptococcus suis]